MIKEFSLDLNKQTTFCNIREVEFSTGIIRQYGTRLRAWVDYGDSEIQKIDLETMVRIFEQDIKDYESAIKNIPSLTEITP